MQWYGDASIAVVSLIPYHVIVVVLYCGGWVMFVCIADVNWCKTCSPDGTCTPIYNATLYHITEFGTVAGEANIMAELYARGPVAVGIDAGPLHK